MPVTPNWNTVEVRGKYVGTDLAPISGRVIFTPKASRLVDQAALTTVIGKAISVTLVNGAFTVELPATDDPDIVPSGFTFAVKEDFTGGSTYDMSVPLAAAGAGIDIATVAPVGPSSGTGSLAVTRAEFDALTAEVEALEAAGPGGTAYDDTAVKQRLTDLETFEAAGPYVTDSDLTPYATDADLSATDGRVTTAEGDIDTLQGQVATLQAAGPFALLRNQDVNLTGASQYVEHVIIVDDGSDTSLWPNRLSFQFGSGGHLTGWFNEYGELRVTPAKTNTVPFRVFSRDASTDTPHDSATPLIEVVLSRNIRTQMWRVDSDGSMWTSGTIKSVGAITQEIANGPTLKAGYLVLATGAAVPANTPANTLIVRPT